MSTPCPANDSNWRFQSAIETGFVNPSQLLDAFGSGKLLITAVMAVCLGQVEDFDELGATMLWREPFRSLRCGVQRSRSTMSRTHPWNGRPGTYNILVNGVTKAMASATAPDRAAMESVTFVFNTDGTSDYEIDSNGPPDPSR